MEISFIRNSLAVIDHIITASPQDRGDLAQHPASIAPAILQALIAFVSIARGYAEASGGNEGKRHSLDETDSSAAVAVMSCLRIFANMSNIAPSWSRDLLTTEGSMTALARVAVDRTSLSSRIATTQENLSETADPTDEGELLCLVLAIITSGVLVDENLASVLASLSEFSLACMPLKCVALTE